MPTSAMAIVAMAPGMFLAHSVVPSSGSTAISTSGPCLFPTVSPMNSIGASSRSPSPITIVPLMGSLLSSRRMAFTAAWSAAFSLPRPVSRAAATAARSVTRTSSRVRTRSNAKSGWTLIDRASPPASFFMASVPMLRFVPRPWSPVWRVIRSYQFFSMRMTCGLPRITLSRLTAASALRTASSVVA